MEDITFMNNALSVISNLALKEERHLLTVAQSEMLDEMCRGITAFFKIYRESMETSYDKTKDSDSDSDGDSPVPTNP